MQTTEEYEQQGLEKYAYEFKESITKTGDNPISILLASALHLLSYADIKILIKNLQAILPKEETEQDLVTPAQILELINKLPDAESHIHICCISGKYCVTNEWFAGNFAGRGFESDNYEDAAQQLIDYMYEHIGHNSIVGKCVTDSGFPNLKKVYDYCKPKVVEVLSI